MSFFELFEGLHFCCVDDRFHAFEIFYGLGESLNLGRIGSVFEIDNQIDFFVYVCDGVFRYKIYRQNNIEYKNYYRDNENGGDG